jgi:RNA polymerase sigma factor (sigma-70 family)
MARSTPDLAELYERHSDDLLVFLARRTADVEVALDLWAETYAQAFRSRKRFRGGSAAEEAGWLWAIARKQLALYYRKGRAETRALTKLGLERPPADPDLEAEITRRAGLSELRLELGRAIAALSEPTREAIELRVVSELSYRDIASRLAITETAARARVSRGLQALGEALDAQAVDEAIRP